MRIGIIVDKENSAIDRLAQYTKKSLPWHQINIQPFHPKKYGAKDLRRIQFLMKWADVIDFQYWKSAEVIMSILTGDAMKKPRLLTHHNPYDLRKGAWQLYTAHIVKNNYQLDNINAKAHKIEHAVDFDFYRFNEEYPDRKKITVNMVANRIEGKKGILDVAQATWDLGYNMILVGRPSDGNYLEKIRAFKHIKFYEGVSDEELRDLYYQSDIHVCNSVDGFESGTMPILEAMACGVPVVSRKVGHVPDVSNGKNIAIHHGQPNDIDGLKRVIKELGEDYEARKKMRHEAIQSIRLRNIEMHGHQYDILYNRYRSKQPLVSVVLTTNDDQSTLAKTLPAILAQTYDNIEVIVCDDSAMIPNIQANRFLVDELKLAQTGFRKAIKHFTTAQWQTNNKVMDYDLRDRVPLKTYGLAHARNVGIRESLGEYVMFLDHRIKPEKDAVEGMVNTLLAYPTNTWVYGVKDNNPKGFVENFSMVKRADIIRMGGFSDWIEHYGGMTQDISKRAELNQMRFVRCESKAESVKSSRGKYRYREIRQSKTACYKLY